ncbi:MAG: Uma2 family endonuclease [Firmicutes bacterium]|nr:Uma2 family endonuclease [Bacillota bacterium]
MSSEQRHIVKDTHIDGSPILIVEILSASTGMKDKVRKLQIYQKAGVKHYWLVDPENQSFKGFVLEGSLYKLAVYGKATDRIIHPVLPGMEIDLQTLWHMD